MAWIRRMGDEEGISLVEMLVSIMLMGIVLMALGSSLTTSMASARQNEGLTHATALANEQFERLQGLSWDRLGVHPSPTDPDTQPTAAFNGASYQTVQLPTTTTGVPRSLSGPISRGGRSYTIRRFIVWRCNNAAETQVGVWCSTTAPRYKQFRIEVTWNEGSRPQRTVLVGRRSTGTGGVGGGAGSTLDLSDGNLFRVVSLAVTPDPIYVQNNGRLVTSSPSLCATPPAAPSPGCGPHLPNATGTASAAVQIDAETSHPASGLMVRIGTAAPVAMTAADSTGLRWTHQIFSGSNQAFGPSGPMDITATATQVATGLTHTDSTQAYVAYPIMFQTSTLTYDTNAPRTYTGVVSDVGDRICVSNTSRLMRNDLPIEIAVRGLTLDDSLWLRRSDGPTWVIDMPIDQLSTLNTTTQSVFDGTLPASLLGTVNTTTVTFNVSYTRSYDGVAGSVNWPVFVKTVGNGYAGVC